MEIWIIGGVIVILMVIVSTRIKRSAAKAFEPEEIDGDDFSITKPEGFLHPLREPADFPFEAYSKLYGERETRNIWRARVRLRIHEGRSIEDVIEEAEKTGEVISERTEDRDPAGSRVFVTESRRREDETEYVIRRKMIENANGRVYELRYTALAPYEKEYESAAETLFGSFRLK